LKDSYFSIYHSDASRLLRGFECYELAWSLDSRAVVFYMESQKKYATLGCRLIVQRIGGREERRIFIEKVPINEISVERIFEFYEHAKREVENVKEHPCKVLGLYERGDIERLNRLSINGKILEALIGKLIVDGEVRIKSSDLSKSISLVAEIVERLKGVLHLGFEFAVSQRPMKADVIIRPEDEQVDYDVDKNEIKMKEWEVFRKIYGIYKERHEKYRSKEEMSEDILRNAIEKIPEEICALKNKIGKIIEFCDDIRTLEQLIRCVRNKGIRIRGETAYTLMNKWAGEVYGKNEEIENFLKGLYMKQEEKERRKLTKLLIKKGVFWRDVVKDAISAIYDRDEDMLREFARKSFKSKEFGGYVREALEDLMLKGGNLREFLRFILNNEGLIIGSCGKVLVNAIFNRLEEGERRKLWKKYEQELSNFGIEPEVRYEEINLRRILAFSFALMIIGFAIGVYVGENFQPIMKISNFITPINQTNVTQSLNQTPSPPLSPLPFVTPAPSPTPIVTVTYYSPTP